MDKELQEIRALVAKERAEGRKVTPEILLRSASQRLEEKHREENDRGERTDLASCLLVIFAWIIVAIVIHDMDIDRMSSSDTIYLLLHFLIGSGTGMAINFFFSRSRSYRHYEELRNLLEHYRLFYGYKDILEDTQK